MDLKRNEDTGEIEYPVQFVRGYAETLQRLKARLLTFAGEWILDTRVGLDWTRWRQLKAPPVAEIAEDIRTEALGLDGVVAAAVQSASFDPTTGEARVVISLRLRDITDDETVTARVEVDPTVSQPTRAIRLEVLYE